MRQKHIVVVDGLWVGHHEIYVKTFAKILLEAGYQVSVLCPDPNGLMTWFKKLTKVSDCRFKSYYFSEEDVRPFRIIPDKFQSYLYSLSRWLHLSQSLKTYILVSDKPDFVFFTWLDSYLHGYLPVRLIDRKFPYMWSGLYFHPRHLRTIGGSGQQKKRRIAPPETFIMQSKRASSVGILDGGIASILSSKLHGKEVVVFPDFTDEISPSAYYYLADEIRNKANGRKIISLLGGLARRKGLLTLIRIVEKSDANDWCFVFAGKMMEQTFSKDELKEIKLFFDTKRENCFFNLEKIQNDADFNALVKVSDVIFAVYDDFAHSSNLVTKSAMYSKRVLVNTEGYMAEVVDRYCLGEAVPPDDILAAMGALHRLVSCDHSNEKVNGMKEYTEEQSQEKLQKVLLSLVETNIGCPNNN